jgi:cytoplasmic iron level regulating protein YaaA (DUF328/UPF0246 family)
MVVMLFLLSPAKSLNFDPPASALPYTKPLFVKESAALIDILKQKSPQEIASLMSLSDKLAGLNVGRYAAWSRTFTAKNAKQAALAFDGDVYDGLNAKTLASDDLAWAQDHLCILSGLYGVLRPLDYMQPYRLEMGTQLVNPRGKDLYQFWGNQIADYLNKRLAADKTPVIVNLASQEYFKAVNKKALKARVVDCVFEDNKGDGYKIISFFAKKARGLMARYAIQHRLTLPEQLKGFDLDGYAYAPEVSSTERLVFRRQT